MFEPEELMARIADLEEQLKVSEMAPPAAEQLIACLEGEIAKRDARIVELQRYEHAFNEWHDKTEWVQAESATLSAKYLGCHRADVMRSLIDDLRAELAACRVAVDNCEVFRARIAELEDDLKCAHSMLCEVSKSGMVLRAELAAIKAQEPVQVDCVAVMRADGDGGLEVEWLLEGGTAELMSGMYLCCVGGGTLLFEEGSGHLYAAPVSEAKAKGVVQWPDADEIMQMAFEEGQPADDASGYCFELEEFDLFIERLMSEVARLNATHVQRVSVQSVCQECNGEGTDRSSYVPLKHRDLDDCKACGGTGRLAAAPSAPAADAGLVEARKANNELVNDLHVMTNKRRQLVDALTYLRECLDPDDYMGEISMHDFIDDALAAHRAKGVV